jgi:signal transduction histidine kinase
MALTDADSMSNIASFSTSAPRTTDFEPIYLDRKVAQARLLLSLLATLSMYVDPNAGGLFHLQKTAFAILLCHLTYSALTYVAVSRAIRVEQVRSISKALDLAFATGIAFLTEGRTSPSTVFFLFAIIAVGFRSGLRDTLLVTALSVALYLLVVTSTYGLANYYAMRGMYLAIAGYFIGFFGQERVNFEIRLRHLEAVAERAAIARSLHDGYLQALSGISLQLASCQDMLMSNQVPEAMAELREMQISVNREHDEVREYVRSLAHDDRARKGVRPVRSVTRFRVDAALAASGDFIEHILQIMLESVRNTRRHGQAASATIIALQAGDTIELKIDDDGVGFADPANPPWTIASRVAELRGRIAIRPDIPGAHLEISIPAT